MTDKTRYCELCEAAQREIARLKAERFAMIDEAIARVKHISGGFEKREYPEELKAELRGYLQWIDIDLTEIRAKYEKGE